MSNITPLTIDNAPEASRPLLEAVKAKMGKVPNLLGNLAHGPAALQAYLSLSETLGGGLFSGQELELIALSIGEANQCDYCVAAHTLIGGMQGLDEDSILAARGGKASNEKLTQLVSLSAEITVTRGNPEPSSVEAFLQSGWTQGHLLELIAAVALNTLTNYTNHITKTEVDFPAAPKLQPA